MSQIVDNMRFVAKDECLSRQMKMSLYKGILLPTLSYGTDGQVSHKYIKHKPQVVEVGALKKNAWQNKNECVMNE